MDGVLDGCGCIRQEPQPKGFRQVGYGEGAYEKVKEYMPVGYGNGSWTKEIIVVEPPGGGGQPRVGCLVCSLSLLLAMGIVGLARPQYFAQLQSTVVEHASPFVGGLRQHANSSWSLRGNAPSAEPSGIGSLAVVQRKPLFSCVVPTAKPDSQEGNRQVQARWGHGALLGALAIQAAWKTCDTDADGRVNMTELDAAGKNGMLSKQVVQILHTADVNGNSALQHTEFVAALTEAGVRMLTGAAASGGLTAMAASAVVEAAFLLVDRDGDGRIQPFELKSAEMDEDDVHPVAREDSKAVRWLPLRLERYADFSTEDALGHRGFAAALAKASADEAGGARLAGRLGGRGLAAVLGAAISEVAWIAADRDTDGRLSEKELQALGQEERRRQLPTLPHSSGDAREALRAADLDGDGKLGRDEFSAAMRRAGVMAEGIVMEDDADNFVGSSRNGAQAWSEARRIWCCQHEGVCFSTTTLQPEPYNCEVAEKLGSADIADEWPSGKKDYCCKHYRVGCTTTTGAHSFDCDKDYDNWAQKWLKNKADWCCRHAQRGCAPSGTTTLSPAMALQQGCAAVCVMDGVAASCSDHVQSAAVHKLKGDYQVEEGQACAAAHGLVMRHCRQACTYCHLDKANCTAHSADRPSPTTALRSTSDDLVEFDCRQGFPDSVKEWAKAKQVWCCTYEGRGCSSESY